MNRQIRPLARAVRCATHTHRKAYPQRQTPDVALLAGQHAGATNSTWHSGRSSEVCSTSHKAYKGHTETLGYRTDDKRAASGWGQTRFASTANVTNTGKYLN